MSGNSENLTIDDGVNAVGTRTQFHFQGDQMIVQRTFDAEPYLDHVRAMRERNEGKGWGEGKEVGYIPPVFHEQIAALQDPDEQRKAVKRFFVENPAFCAYAPFLKG